MDNKTRVANEMKAYRNRAKLKVQEIAKLLTVSQPYISMVENGKGNLPTKEFLRKYAEVISKKIEGEDSELIYGRLLLSAGYQVDNLESLVEDGRFFTQQKNKSYIEYTDDESFKILEKPYYNLNWLLSQSQNEVYIEVEVNGENKIQELGEKDKVYLKQMVQMFYEIKFMDELEEDSNQGN